MLKEILPPRRATPEHPTGWWSWLVWALFGNEDDGPHGDKNFKCPVLLWIITPSVNWRWWRAVAWWVRNPAHNLCFYVWGVADKPRTFYSTQDWGSVKGWTYHATQCEGRWLPFASYKGWCNFYVGWRPYGAFGLKFNFAK